MANPISPQRTLVQTGSDATPSKHACPDATEHFEKLMGDETEVQAETLPARHSFIAVMPDISLKVPTGGDSKKQKDADIFTEPKKPEIPDPKKEAPSNFWGRIKSGVDSMVKDATGFLSSPEFAQFAKVANIVFAGGLVVAAGVLAATGVGAPASVALLAIAGGVGLAMQAPPIQQKIQAGVEAIIAPVIGAKDAAKLSPILTQGVVTASIIGILVSGGGAGNIQGVLDASMGFFKSMGDMTNGIAQFYQAAEPFLSLAGIDTDPKAIGRLGALFGTLESLIPGINSYAQGIGQSLVDFVANPDLGGFLDFLKKSGTTLPDDLLNLLDNNILSNIGSFIMDMESLISDPGIQGLADLLRKLR